MCHFFPDFFLSTCNFLGNYEALITLSLLWCKGHVPTCYTLQFTGRGRPNVLGETPFPFPLYQPRILDDFFLD